MRTRLLRYPLGRWVDPAAAWAALNATAENSFWLDGGPSASSGVSYLGSSTRVLTDADGDVFESLRTSLASEGVEPDAAGGFALGWVGWLGYELRALTMGESVRESRYPVTALMFVDRAVAFDHATGIVSLLALGDSWDGALGDWRDQTAVALAGAVVPATASAVPVSRAVWAYSDDEYLGMIEACQRSIAAGDAYQLCLTTEARIDVHPDPFAAYLALRSSSPSHHGGLLVFGSVALLSASPEQFLAVSPAGLVSSSPIKGTRRRGVSSSEDELLRAELEASDKERAENLMIVDLMRNDIGRISEVGSVRVPRLLEVETYAHVHQLVSEVTGQLASGLRPVDAVIACFPAGSMTGAPKLSATRILDSLERRARGVYAGAFGYLGLDGGVDLAMVIRSIVIDSSGATVGSGGGITALSVPSEELEEVRIKAAALLAVLGSR
jgi:anthranilate synthase component 1